MTAGVKANVDGSAAIQVGGSDAINISTGLTVGIGTSSPGAKLDVRGSSTFLVNATSPTAWVSVDSALTTGSVYTQWNTSTNEGIFGSYTNHPIYFVTNNNRRLTIDTSGNVGIGTSSPSSNSLTLVSKDVVLSDGYGPLWGTTTKAQIAGYASGILQFFAGGSSERARIDSSGNLLVNTTTRTGGERMALWYSSNSGPGLNIRDTNAQNGNTFIQFNNGATTAGAITSNGTTTMTYGSASDYRLKENLVPLTGALAKIAALQPKTGNWKVDGSEFVGFVAHELQEVFPDAVVGAKDRVDDDGNPLHQMVDTGSASIIATLTAAIQEQQQMIETLQAKVAALEGA